MKFDLKERTILVTVAGSRAYGMDTPESDVDLKGVCIKPSSYSEGFIHSFDQADEASHMMAFYNDLLPIERAKAYAGELEGSIYEIRKFFKLAAGCNPNILDALFCREEDVRYQTALGMELRANASLFLSKKAKFTFSGYAYSQLKRIRTHRRWLLDPPKAPPTRAESNLPERTVIPADQLMAAQAAITKKVDSWEIDFDQLDEAAKIYVQEQIESFMVELSIYADEKYQAAARSIGYDENFIELLDRERHYKAAATQWVQYNDWKTNRNKKRAALEAKHGFDTKHGSHLVRLIRMCAEILETGQVNVYRPDADELLAIRAGAWSYDKLIDFAESQDRKINELYKTCNLLPRAPDREKLNESCISLVKRLP